MEDCYKQARSYVFEALAALRAARNSAVAEGDKGKLEEILATTRSVMEAITFMLDVLRVGPLTHERREANGTDAVGG